MDILTGKNLSISVGSIDLIHWSVCSSSRRDGVKGWMEYKVIIASYEYHFIRVHENLVQHSSNNMSILEGDSMLSRYLYYPWGLI